MGDKHVKQIARISYSNPLPRSDARKEGKKKILTANSFYLPRHTKMAVERTTREGKLRSVIVQYNRLKKAANEMKLCLNMKIVKE